MSSYPSIHLLLSPHPLTYLLPQGAAGSCRVLPPHTHGTGVGLNPCWPENKHGCYAYLGLSLPLLNANELFSQIFSFCFC